MIPAAKTVQQCLFKPEKLKLVFSAVISYFELRTLNKITARLITASKGPGKKKYEKNQNEKEIPT